MIEMKPKTIIVSGRNTRIGGSKEKKTVNDLNPYNDDIIS
jgi:hypothetical protein